MRILKKLGVLDYTSLGDRIQRAIVEYLRDNALELDFGARAGGYDLVVLGTDFWIPENLRGKYSKVLIQEGLIWPFGPRFVAATKTGLPRFIANSNAEGHSNDYDFYCVASAGYRDLFIATGLDAAKLRVTGLPNFDDIKNIHGAKSFEHSNYVLVTTHPLREDLEYEDRSKVLLKAREVAHGRKIIVKFHPRENFERAEREVRLLIPDAICYRDGDTEAMIANCDVFLATFSSTLLTALALEKPIAYAHINIERLRPLLPEQTGKSADRIAEVCREVVKAQRRLTALS